MFEDLRNARGREAWEALIDRLEYLLPKAGRGVRIHHADRSRPVIEAIAPRPGRSGSGHPFRIEVAKSGSTWTATVGAGVGHYAVLANDSSTIPMPTMDDMTWAQTDLTGLADNTTYGLWLRWAVGWTSLTGFTKQSGFGSTIAQPIYATPGMISSSTYNAKTDLASLTGSTSGYAYMWIGQVAIASGVVTVSQGLTENPTITRPTITLAAAVVSADADNEISAGSDGLAYYVAP